MNGQGFADRFLTATEAEKIVQQATAGWQLDGKRVLALIPDHTRSCPLDLLYRLAYEAIAPRAKCLDVLVALGTHPPMPMDAIYHRVGITPEQHATKYTKTRFFNHAWNDPAQLVEVGRFTKKDIRELTDGLFEMDVGVSVNKMINDYDLLLILGPVFPHEVVGFSGGCKYIFPGIAGEEILNFFHWLGAVITNPRIIGCKWTPVRKVVDRAAAFLKIERRAFCMVVRGHDGLAGLYAGTPEEAWSTAADLSRQVHIEFKDKPFHTVLSCAPKMYDELWVGAKCMYKLEPVVADGGKLIIYAPHIHEIAVAHDKTIRAVGYHTRDYFLKQWDKFKHYPWGVLAHSTHVKGIGKFENGVETPRIECILATGIPETTCRQINLGYMDPAKINPADYANREAEGILHVPKAGEVLYRLKNAPPELGG
jgi:nickel-dependent lactate racemase